MAFSFNVIACMLPLSGSELESAGVLFGRVLTNAIQCPSCGVKYGLIAPASISGEQLHAAARELLSEIYASCGDHPPLIQKQDWTAI